MTERLFQDQPYLASTQATVLSASPDGVVLDRTIFYARGGGQPGDTGILRWMDGEMRVADTIKGDGEAILHVPAPDAALPPVGTVVEAAIDWARGIASQPRSALVAAKRAVIDGLRLPLSEGLRLEAQLFAEFLADPATLAISTLPGTRMASRSPDRVISRNAHCGRVAVLRPGPP